MIQDIAPHVYHNEYRPQRPSPDSIAMVFVDGKISVKVKDGEISFPKFGELEEKYSFIYEDYTYLFSIDEDRYYLLQNVELEEGELWGRKELRYGNPQYLAFAGLTACQLYGWYKSHQYCGRCGKRMKHDEKERMLWCEECHQMEYPKICPAVIVGITNGNHLLLSKYAGREHAKYALIAGFTEIGETIEETVHREVMEEVGLRVKNLTYYKSQPWSVSDSLLFGFYAEVDGSAEITLDEEELALAEWFEREEIPVTEESNSLTNEMILNFKSGRYGR